MFISYKKTYLSFSWSDLQGPQVACCHLPSAQLWSGLLTRPWAHEAKAEAEARKSEAEIESEATESEAEASHHEAEATN